MDIFSACFYGDLVRVQELFSKEANAKDELGCAPLHWASCNGHLAVVKFLVSRGACVEVKNDCDSTPLLYAHVYGQWDVVKYLRKQFVREVFLSLCRSSKVPHDLVRSLFTYVI
jgi:ankyrin repeat protein